MVIIPYDSQDVANAAIDIAAYPPSYNWHRRRPTDVDKSIYGSIPSGTLKTARRCKKHFEQNRKLHYITTYLKLDQKHKVNNPPKVSQSSETALKLLMES